MPTVSRALAEESANGAYTGPVVRNPLAPVPKASGKLGRGMLALRDRLNRTLNDPEARDAEMKEVEAILNEAQPYLSPSLTRGFRNLLETWELIVPSIAGRPIPQEELWNVDIVAKYAREYLVIRFRNTEGRDGQQYVKATTLQYWRTILAQCVVKYTSDTEGKRCGGRLLAAGGLYTELETQVNHLIVKYQLDRHLEPKEYYGRNEFQLVIQKAIETATLDDVFMRLQTLCAMAFGFAAGPRASTLAPCAPEYAERGLYPKLEDIRLFRENGGITVHFHAKHFKGANGPGNGKEQHLVFSAAENWYNVVFELSVWLCQCLIYRGALYYKTAEELMAGKEAEVLIRPEFKTQPLFTAGEPGGREGNLTDPVPQTAGAMSNNISHLCQLAGLKSSGMYAFRRTTIDGFAREISVDIASAIAGHDQDVQAVFKKHYWRGVENIPLLAIRLGEMKGPNSAMAEAATKQQMFTSAAVRCLVTQRAREAAGYEAPQRQAAKAAQQLSDEALQAIKEDPEMEQASREIERGWDIMYALFPGGARGYRDDLVEDKGRVFRLRQDLQPLSSTTEEALNDAEAILFAAVDKRHKIEKKLKKKARSVELKARLHAEHTGVLSYDTAENRLDAIESFKQPMSTLRNILEANRKGVAGVIDPSMLRFTSETWDSMEDEEDAEVEDITGSMAKFEKHLRFYSKPNPKGKQPAEESQQMTPPSEFAEPDGESSDMIGFQPPEGGISDKPFDAAETTGNIVEGGEMDVSEVRVQFMDYVLKPVREYRAMRTYWQKDGKCLSCQAYIHDDARMNKQWTRFTNLSRHIQEKHNPWAELEQHMYLPDGQFGCPLKACDFEAKSIKLVREHCLKGCEHSKEFRAIKEEHDGYRMARNEAGAAWKAKKKGMSDKAVAETGASNLDTVAESIQAAQAPVSTEAPVVGAPAAAGHSAKASHQKANHGDLSLEERLAAAQSTLPLDVKSTCEQLQQLDVNALLSLGCKVSSHLCAC
ncbi:uncharacterized protein C8Q71DRAFT_741315 [Rhodofomes roseus]|uniref:Uncharacterized protein n=1 Tax=Rhodofomes roseus TaxID=34475 RepID=A0ABQ8KQ98_9APHY|nr:uncharacterized protein C8Q71DRAFT_741315 [Rhodofomes roseus]KAH9840801.1 hypothetical protein C8Q71DRAFT_741315 [Rhodofomes roseus]